MTAGEDHPGDGRPGDDGRSGEWRPDEAAALERPAPALLTSALRRARIENAERAEARADVAEAERARLELLREAVRPVFDALPDTCECFDLGLSQGVRPRLFLDMIAFVELARDRKTYVLRQDSRRGRLTLATTARLEDMVGAVTDYVARRLIEREKALSDDAHAAKQEPAATEEPAAANGPAADGARSDADAHAGAAAGLFRADARPPRADAPPPRADAAPPHAEASLPHAEASLPRADAAGAPFAPIDRAVPPADWARRDAEVAARVRRAAATTPEPARRGAAQSGRTSRERARSEAPPLGWRRRALELVVALVLIAGALAAALWLIRTMGL